MSNQNKSRYKKIAAECYEQVSAESKGRFHKEDVRDALVAEIIAQGLADDVVDDFVDGLLDAEDKKRTGGSNGGQLDLFSGEEAALDHVLALGGGERIRARHATLPDLYANLGLRADNAARVNQAFARAQADVARLTPYLTDPTVTVEAALAAWRRDNTSE